MVPNWCRYGTMASFTLKNLPDDLMEALRDAAESDRRSLNQEIMHLLSHALRARSLPTADVKARRDVQAQLAAWRKLAGKWVSDVDRASEAAQLRKRRSRGREVDL